MSECYCGHVEDEHAEDGPCQVADDEYGECPCIIFDPDPEAEVSR